MVRQERVRNVCFTLYRDEQPNWVPDVMRYMVFNRERCPTSGREHWQGYCEFKKQVGFEDCKTLIGDSTTHVEKRRGTAQEASDYCKKLETRVEGTDYVEFGKISRPGTRTDLDTACEIVREHGIKRVAEELPSMFVKYHKGFVALASQLAKPRDWAPEVFYLWGATGVGKTRRVFDSHDDVWVYPGKGWFDGYCGQEVVLFDDWHGEWNDMSRDMVLRLFDRYPMHVPVKGGFVNWAPRVIYVTSNYGPNPDPAFRRRISSIEEVGEAQGVVDTIILVDSEH